MTSKKAQPKFKKGGFNPTLLIILDGFGLANFKNKGNAITPETAPNIFALMEKYPHTTLTAHGKDVGLFPNQQGNSEAGHFNIGSGRIVKQDLCIISNAIKDGTFFKNEAFEQAFYHVQKYHTNVHVMGLLTNSNSAHARPEHLYALLEYFRRKKQKNVYLHLFTDGRDSSPHGSIKFLKELRKHMKNGEKIATIMGRFYAMDRNKMWERTQKAYEAMVLGKGCCAPSAEEAILQSYNRGDTDEYICPTTIIENNKPVAIIKNNDVVYFYNARSDRARQITKAFVQDDFNSYNGGAFERKKRPKNIRFVAMTDFGPDLPGIFTAFPSPDIKNALAKTIDDNKHQLYISETEKYAHMTYFINGGFADPVNGEVRELVKSTGNYSYAEHPEMRCREVAKIIIKYLQTKQYDFIAVNFPNADMVGHTGNIEATKKGIKAMDEQVKLVVSEVLKSKGQVLITADHGNAEEMLQKKTNEMMTEHTTNPVPCIIIGLGKKVRLKKGRLADVAPTLLKMMNIKKPGEMTGRALF